MAERYRLDQNIADRGRFHRAGDNLALGSVGSKFVEQSVSASATDNVQPTKRPSGKLLNFFQSHPVQKRQALQDAPNKLSRYFRSRLAGFQAITGNSLRHVTRLYKTEGFGIDQRTKRFSSLGFFDQSGIF